MDPQEELTDRLISNRIFNIDYEDKVRSFPSRILTMHYEDVKGYDKSDAPYYLVNRCLEKACGPFSSAEDAAMAKAIATPTILEQWGGWNHAVIVGISEYLEYKAQGNR